MHVIFIVEGLQWFQDEEQQHWGFSLLILYGFVSCAFNTHLFFSKDGNALYDVHMYIELSTIFRNIQIFLVFISIFNISGRYFLLIFMKKWTVRMSKQPFPLKNRLVVEAFGKIKGNQRKLHSVLCSIVRVETTTVNISSLYSRIKSVYSTSKKYGKFFSKHRYNEYLAQVFTFSKSAKKNRWL